MAGGRVVVAMAEVGAVVVVRAVEGSGLAMPQTLVVQ